MKPPMFLLALRYARECRVLHGRNAELTQALTLANRTAEAAIAGRDHIAGKYQQAVRDCELMAFGWSDRKQALEFIRTAHDIDRLEAS